MSRGYTRLGIPKIYPLYYRSVLKLRSLANFVEVRCMTLLCEPSTRQMPRWSHFGAIHVAQEAFGHGEPDNSEHNQRYKKKKQLEKLCLEAIATLQGVRGDTPDFGILNTAYELKSTVAVRGEYWRLVPAPSCVVLRRVLRMNVGPSWIGA